MDNYPFSSLLMEEIIGKPLENLAWSPLSNFHPREIERVPESLRGVYLIRYRDTPKQMKPASMLYVGKAQRCLKDSLREDYLGKGNVFLPDFVQVNPSEVYFQYLCCEDCHRVEAYLLVTLDYQF